MEKKNGEKIGKTTWWTFVGDCEYYDLFIRAWIAMIIATDFIAVTTTRDAINIQRKKQRLTHTRWKKRHIRESREKNVFEKSSDCTNNE